MMDDNIPQKVKNFFKVARQVRTRIVDLQDTLSSTTESVRQAADIVDTDVQKKMEKILKSIEDARKSTRSASKCRMSGFSGFFTSAKHKAAKEDEENASSPKEPTDLNQLTEDVVKAEKQLEETAKTVVEELGRVLVLIQVELPFDQNLKFPDFGGVAKHLQNLANELKAHAMEELKQLAEKLKTQLGDAGQKFMKGANEAGAGGLLDEVVGVLTDAVAEKRSEMEKWRVREVAAVCVKMLAAAPLVRGNLEEEVQGALVQRQALETNDKVLGALRLGTELPKRLAELAGATTLGSENEEVGQEDVSDKPAETAETKTDVDAAQCAMSLQKDVIASTLSKRMEALADLEEQARNESDGLKKSVLLNQCRMVRKGVHRFTVSAYHLPTSHHQLL